MAPPNIDPTPAPRNVQPTNTIPRCPSSVVPYFIPTLSLCKCQDKHVHFRLFKHVQNQSFSLLK
ncbi:hypothetical protein BK756_20775 [Bacillus thuringiensis serovar aizawai]|nr:hypothetical protein BK756_20775 [Bacillus thuringiensis serovar aizawai]